MEFELTDVITDSSSLLYYQSQEVMTDGKTYQMSVGDAFEITGDDMYENGDSMALPSTARVFAFRVNAVSLYGDEIVVEDAQYVTDSGTEWYAEGSSVSSMKYENMIGRSITEKDQKYLFFITTDPEHADMQYDGILKLKLQGSDEWLSVNVALG